MIRRVLLIASTTGYQTREFASAAERLGIELVFATDRCHILENPWGDEAIPVRFEDPSAGFDALVAFASGPRGKFDGIVAVGDRPAYIASQAAERLGLRFSPPSAVAASKNKFLARERFRAAGLLVPNYSLLTLDANPSSVGLATHYPCVLKPLGLSGSRGVIRANHAAEFLQAFARIKRLLEELQKSAPGTVAAEPNESIPANAAIQVEDFIPGREFALEGLITAGRLHVLAIFDKPDALDGPFFEETIYVTPSRASDSIQGAITETTQAAIGALGLMDGPVHAEMRVNPSGIWMLEVAARPIGGLCSRSLRFQGDRSLEELILRHAVGEDVSGVELASGAHGVMMIPIPYGGIYAGVDGLDQARGVPGIADVMISAKEGQFLEPLPEGASYLGFIFARGLGPDLVERSLRKAHGKLTFHLNPALPVVR